jgi:hypothetical protein
MKAVFVRWPHAKLHGQVPLRAKFVWQRASAGFIVIHFVSSQRSCSLQRPRIVQPDVERVILATLLDGNADAGGLGGNHDAPLLG